MRVNRALTLRRDSKGQFDQANGPGVERAGFSTCCSELFISGPYVGVILGDLCGAGWKFSVHVGLILFDCARAALSPRRTEMAPARISKRNFFTTLGSNALLETVSSRKLSYQL
jgi:hypothetical protein